MAEHQRRGACSGTGKRCFDTRALAKQNLRRNHLPDLSVYKCDDCGYFHLGGWHGTKDRAAHRGEIQPETMPVSEAGRTLNVSSAFIERLIETGKIRATNGQPFRADIERLLTK